MLPDTCIKHAKAIMNQEIPVVKSHQATGSYLTALPFQTAEYQRRTGIPTIIKALIAFIKQIDLKLLPERKTND